MIEKPEAREINQYMNINTLPFGEMGIKASCIL